MRSIPKFVSTLLFAVSLSLGAVGYMASDVQAAVAAYCDLEPIPTGGAWCPEGKLCGFYIFPPGLKTCQQQDYYSLEYPYPYLYSLCWCR